MNTNHNPENISNNLKFEDMTFSKIWSLIFNHLAKQGLSLLLLIAAIYYFYGKNNLLQEKVDLCYSENKEFLRQSIETQIELKTDIEQLTKQLEKNNE